MEVYYKDYTPDQVARLKNQADSLGLVPCGGTDYHASGNPGEPEPGDVGPAHGERGGAGRVARSRQGLGWRRMTPVAVLFVIGAYLAGGVPSGYILARRLRGIDIREYGSGNVGASNVTAIIGARAGVLLGAYDCLVKGMLPVLIAGCWTSPRLYR